MTTIERSHHENDTTTPCETLQTGVPVKVAKALVLASAITFGIVTPTAVTTAAAASPIAPTASIKDPNQTGAQPSAYKGKKYRATQEKFRKCIAHREGRFHYFGTGSNGKYQSTYQMTTPLVRGAAWMMRPELLAMWGRVKGEQIFRTLLNTPGHLWSRFYMDMAFYTVLNAGGIGSGARHWNKGETICGTAHR